MAVRKKVRRMVRQSIRVKNQKQAVPGSSPGILTIAPDASKPKLKLYSYNKEQLIEKDYTSLNDVLDFLNANPQLFHWIEIKGIGDKQLLEDICRQFDIHPLEMEDVTNVYQRPKHEEHASHLFIVSRMLSQNADNILQNDQLSIFCGLNYVITIQDKYEDIFEPLRNRLRSGRGMMRTGGSGYLTYAINDAIVDHYFPILEKTGDLLDELEDELLSNVARQSLQKIQDNKRELIVFRRAAFAERDKINDMLRTNNEFINDETKVFLKDTYDHIIQVLDLVDSYKEITASLMDIYLSSISNRLNQVMKVMTVFSAIFMPLTFIVGIYGMNFAREDPETGKFMPYNMPELYSPNGYIMTMSVIILVVILEFWYFMRKGWLFRD
ncbi:MAG: magnesium/cobalt transporter CorA [Bacteroidia bacterium]